METKHTRGPWKVEHDERADIFCLVDPQGLRITSDETVGDHKSGSECRANFDLMAAAPELLEAAQAAVYFLHTACLTDPRWQGGKVGLDMLRAAIAKAEGKP